MQCHVKLGMRHDDFVRMLCLQIRQKKLSYYFNVPTAPWAEMMTIHMKVRHAVTGPWVHRQGTSTLSA